MDSELDLMTDKLLNLFADRNFSFTERLRKERIGFLTRIFDSADLVFTFQVQQINLYTNPERNVIIIDDLEQNIISIYNWTIIIKDRKVEYNSVHPDKEVVSKHADWITEIKDLSSNIKVIAELKSHVPFEQRSSAGEDLEIFLNPNTEELILNEDNVLRFFSLNQKRYIK